MKSGPDLLNALVLLTLLMHVLPHYSHSQSIYLSLGSTIITSNNTEILITEIGEDVESRPPSLTCHTDLTECCRASDHPGTGGLGAWYNPDGRALLNNGDSWAAGEGFYRVRNVPQVIRLRRRDAFISTVLAPTGPFCCVIPTTRGEMTFCAKIVVCLSLSLTNGMISYSDPTLGVNSVANHSCDAGYILNGGSTRVCQSDGTWTGSQPSCAGLRIIGSPNLTVGQSATLVCEYDAVGLIEWLDSDVTVLASGSGSSLNYTISPVSDSLHQSTLTCRVPGGSVSITLSVDVSPHVLTLTITDIGSPVAGSEYSLRCEVSPTVSGLTNSPTAEWTVSGSDPQVSSSGGVSTLTFSTLRTFQGGSYTCVGRLVSPSLTQTLEIQETRTVIVEIPSPGVSVTPPPSTLTAGTPLTLTCSIAVDSAVDVNVMVDVTWVVTTDTNPIITTSHSTATGFVADTLTIPILSTRYTGVTCRARVRTVGIFSTILDSQEGMDTVNLNISTPPPPVVTVNTTGESVASSAFSLLCTATSPTPLVRPPVVSWVGVVNTDYDVTITESGSSVSESSLVVTFDPLKTSHGRVYMCQADYDIPEADLPSRLSLISRPVIVQIPTHSVASMSGRSPGGEEIVLNELNIGLELDLVCRLELDPAVDSDLLVTSLWTKDESPLSPDSSRLNISEPVKVQQSPQVFESIVSFRTLITEDTGSYNCTLAIQAVSEMYIADTTTTVSRRFAVKDFPVQSVQLSGEETVDAGDTLFLTCVTEKDSSLTTAILELDWLGPNGFLMARGRPGIVVTANFSSTDYTLSSTLTFPSISTSQAGPYTCRVNLTISEAGVTDYSVSRVSHVRVKIPPPEMVVVIASRTAALFEGTTGLVISCEVTLNNTGVDTDTVVTRGINGPGAARGRVSSSPQGVTLSISPLALSDDGLYTCTTSVGSKVNTEYILTSTPTLVVYTLTVMALPAPVVTIPAQTSVQAGDSLTLTCSVSVVPLLASPPIIQWTNSSGQSLSSVESGHYSTVSFDPVRTSDADQYTCTATIKLEEVGIIGRSSEESMNLTVTAPPPTVTVTTSEPVYHGAAHTISCVSSYNLSVVDTPVTYSWTGPTGDDLVSSDIHFISSGPSGSTLTLSPVDQPSVSNGNYTCTVTAQSENTLLLSGTGSDSVTLNVLAAPAPLVVTDVPVRRGQCGEVVSITCSANNIIVDNFVTRPVITWQGPGGETVDSDETLDTGLMSPSMLGEYICMACVTVESVDIVGLCSNTTVTITSEVPERVSNISCPTTGSPNTLEVVWSPPTGQPVLSYWVEIRQYVLRDDKVSTVSLRKSDILPTKPKITVDGLAPVVRYLVSVEAGGGGGCGSPVTVECYTEEGEPPTVAITDVIRLNLTAMNVSWTPINIVQARGFISFNVTYAAFIEHKAKRQTNSVTVAGDQSNVVVGGLDPMLQYNVTIATQSGGGTSQSSAPVSVEPIPSVLFQLRLLNINTCPEWVDQKGRTAAVTRAFITEVEAHCQCGFTAPMITAPLFRCFPQSTNAVTLRARLIDSRFLTAVEDWVQESGLIPTEGILIEVDKTCQVAITSLADMECTSQSVSTDNSVAIIGGVVGGVVMVLIIAITVTIISLAVLLFKSKKQKITVRRMIKRELPPISNIEPYEMVEMGHEYEDISKFRHRGRISLKDGSREYDIDTSSAVKQYENVSTVVTPFTKSHDPPTELPQTPPPASQHIPTPQLPQPPLTPQASLPTPASQASLLTLAPQASLPTPAPQSSLPTPAPQSSLPTPAPQSSLPTPAPQASLPTPAPQASLPTPAPQVSLPTPASQASLPTTTASQTENEMGDKSSQNDFEFTECVAYEPTAPPTTDDPDSPDL